MLCYTHDQKGGEYMSVVRSITCSAEFLERIKKAAESEGISVNKYIVLAVKERLEREKR